MEPATVFVGFKLCLEPDRVATVVDEDQLLAAFVVHWGSIATWIFLSLTL